MFAPAHEPIEDFADECYRAALGGHKAELLALAGSMVGDEETQEHLAVDVADGLVVDWMV